LRQLSACLFLGLRLNFGGLLYALLQYWEVQAGDYHRAK
jgi:hypothetical protein